MGVSETQFYDATRIAIVPMGHCFPGLDAKGGDLPPRRECAPQWRPRIPAALPAIELILVIGLAGDKRNRQPTCHPLAAPLMAQQRLAEEQSLV
eukprot:gene43414-57788_t